MRPLRFWTDDFQVNGHHPEPRPPTWARILGLLCVAGALWLLVVLGSLIADG